MYLRRVSLTPNDNFIVSFCDELLSDDSTVTDVLNMTLSFTSTFWSKLIQGRTPYLDIAKSDSLPLPSRIRISRTNKVTDEDTISVDELISMETDIRCS